MTNDYSTGAATASAGSSPWRAGTARSRVLWLVPTLAFCALTSWACSWQLSRAHAKLVYEAEVKERSALPPLTGAAIARDAADGALQSQRHVDVEGQWDAAHTVLLMNRTMGERPGFYVMTPLRLADGGAVLVQRGWVAGVDGDPSKAPPLTTPAGPVALHGHVAPWPSHWFDLGHGTGGAVRQNVELAPFSAESGLTLRPVIVVEDANAGNANDGLGRDWPAPTAGVSIATHYGYAAQWAAMAVASLGLYAWLQFVRPRKRASTDPDSPLDARVDDTSPR